MFFSIDDNAPPELLNSPNESNYSPYDGPPGPPHDFGFYFYLVVNNLIQIATIVLNFFVSGLVLSHRKKSLGTSFYIMAALLMTILCIEGTVNEVNYALIAGFHIRNAGILWITTIINIYTSYCSVILIWLLGLNRMAIFVMPQLNEFIFTKAKLIIHHIDISLILDPVKD